LDPSGSYTYTISDLQDLIPPRADIFGFDIPLTDDLKQVEIAFGNTIDNHPIFTRQNYFALASFHVHMFLSGWQRKHLRLIWNNEVLRAKAVIMDGMPYADVVVPEITIRLMTMVVDTTGQATVVPFYSWMDLSGLSADEIAFLQTKYGVDPTTGLLVSHLKYCRGTALKVYDPSSISDRWHCEFDLNRGRRG
jgi:hypothetical protein